MSLSTMQEILVLLEDEKCVPLYRLNRWGRPARGVLAKLKNLDYAKKITTDNEICYQITDKGKRVLVEKMSQWRDFSMAMNLVIQPADA